MVRKSGQQGVPVIEIDGQIVVGFDRARLERIIADVQSGRVPFGAAVADASKILMQRGQIPVFGAYVGKVSPGSPAHRAGLAPGDIITELNFRKITSAADVEQALQSLQRGSRVTVVFLRGEKSLRTEVSV